MDINFEEKESIPFIPNAKKAYEHFFKANPFKQKENVENFEIPPVLKEKRNYSLDEIVKLLTGKEIKENLQEKEQKKEQEKEQEFLHKKRAAPEQDEEEQKIEKESQVFEKMVKQFVNEFTKKKKNKLMKDLLKFIHQNKDEDFQKNYPKIISKLLQCSPKDATMWVEYEEQKEKMENILNQIGKLVAKFIKTVIENQCTFEDTDIKNEAVLQEKQNIGNKINEYFQISLNLE